MKKLILGVASVLTLTGGYLFFATSCCGPNDICEPQACCADKDKCCHQTATASLELK